MRLGLTADELADVKRRAAAAGTSVEEFVRQTVLAGVAADASRYAALPPKADAAPPPRRCAAIIAGEDGHEIDMCDWSHLTCLREMYGIEEVVIRGTSCSRRKKGGVEWAQQKGILITRIPAEHVIYQGLAQDERDARMVDYVLSRPGGPHVCVLFSQGATPTAHLRECALARGMRVYDMVPGRGPVYAAESPRPILPQRPERVDAKFCAPTAPSSWTTPEQADDAKPEGAPGASPDISGARLRAGVAEIGGTFATEVDMADAIVDPPATEAPTIAPVAQPTPCPKCNGTGRIGTPPVRFRCPECLGAGSLARP
jgi:hypothetical protein